MQIKATIAMLKTAGVLFAPGISDTELRQIETLYRLRFPPDLKEFLKSALPISKGFPNWRDGAEREIMSKLEWPYDGMCFDIKNNAFWLDRWGEQPASTDAACAIARQAVGTAPVLIPIYSHRYIPDRPCERGNPVLSVYQTDIIFYGRDLSDYFENEFSRTSQERELALQFKHNQVKRIEFWSDIIER